MLKVSFFSYKENEGVKRIFLHLFLLQTGPPSTRSRAKAALRPTLRRTTLRTTTRRRSGSGGRERISPASSCKNSRPLLPEIGIQTCPREKRSPCGPISQRPGSG
ncbi:hypothetical protein TNIN_458421 [Trichonephila inaurata madagascariensis]|uniref:Uncharacterized protein n=1 Tax=Trichonephila inaurata madagascariensis TaxID=2747483 RepID=A0A8X6YCP3_9ARAC|nr:hypothetical protein TNIN_458421 [Trichonephila inaurata madagascariensis]